MPLLSGCQHLETVDITLASTGREDFDNSMSLVETVALLPALRSFTLQEDGGGAVATGQLPTCKELAVLQTSTLDVQCAWGDGVGAEVLALGSLPVLVDCCLVWDNIMGSQDDDTLTVDLHSFANTGSLTSLVFDGHYRPIVLEPGCLDTCGPLCVLGLLACELKTVPLAIAGVCKTVQSLMLDTHLLQIDAQAAAVLLECASLTEFRCRAHLGGVEHVTFLNCRADCFLERQICSEIRAYIPVQVLVD